MPRNLPLEARLNRCAKRIIDVCVALPTCITILPLLGIIILLAQTIQSPGPLFHNRMRVGRNRRPFKMYKFRSMLPNDEHSNSESATEDARIFPFGKIMRKRSLDEFPQFINVLLGDMSVVGPRPHLIEHDTYFRTIANQYDIRAQVKPGITGLAQTRGYRGTITTPRKLNRRVCWDLYYISHWSAKLDVKIIIQTLRHVFMPLPPEP